MKKNVQLFLDQLTIRSVFITGLFLAFLFVFAFIAKEVVYESDASFDKYIIAFLSIHSSPAMIQIMKGFTFLGSFYFLVPAYLILISYFTINKKTAYATSILIIAVSSTVAMFGLKQLFRRQRPSLPLIKDISGYSFPSGHALSGFIFCSILCYIIWKSGLPAIWKWILVLLLLLVAITIGVSRIVLNVHYATDVIASFCLGFVWAIVSLIILNKWVK